LVHPEEGEGQAGLRIEVDEQDPATARGQVGTEVGGDRRLTHAALVVDDGHDARRHATTLPYRAGPGEGRSHCREDTEPVDLPERIRQSGFRELAITFDHAVAASRLPLLHRDPFDRMLVAQARHEDLTLATRDPDIQRYEVSVLAV